MAYEITSMPASQLARLIRARAVSPVEVMEAYLNRIEALNPMLNAIVTLAPDAMDRARRAEESLVHGGNLGPLHGVPVTIKDSIETAGLLSTSGSLMRENHVPDVDAPAVSRLKRAGAIVLGKTNLSEMAMAYDADNPLFGATINPYDATRTPGGSSGGEGAAISAGLSAAGLGSDLAGSIRIPAHFCGIAGLKPTTGVVPAAGQYPSCSGPFSLGAVVGPMARSVTDLALLFDVLCTTEQHENIAFQTYGDLREHELAGVKVAWYSDDGVISASEPIRQAIERAASVLKDAGMVTAEVRPPGIERGPRLWSQLFSYTARFHLHQAYAEHEERAGPFVQAMLKSGGGRAADTLEDFIRAWTERDLLLEILLKWMNQTPLILAPVTTSTAFILGERTVEIEGKLISVFASGGYSQTFNVFGMPAVCVPAGRSREGLPIGVQIAGRPYQEKAILAAALLIEKAAGGWQSPEPVLSNHNQHPL